MSHVGLRSLRTHGSIVWLRGQPMKILCKRDHASCHVNAAHKDVSNAKIVPTLTKTRPVARRGLIFYLHFLLVLYFLLFLSYTR